MRGGGGVSCGGGGGGDAIEQFDIDVEVVVDRRHYTPINIYITKDTKKV